MEELRQLAVTSNNPQSIAEALYNRFLLEKAELELELANIIALLQAATIAKDGTEAELAEATTIKSQVQNIHDETVTIQADTQADLDAIEASASTQVNDLVSAKTTEIDNLISSSTTAINDLITAKTTEIDALITQATQDFTDTQNTIDTQLAELLQISVDLGSIDAQSIATALWRVEGIQFITGYSDEIITSVYGAQPAQ